MALISVGGMIGLVCWLSVILLPIALLVVLQVLLCKKSVNLGLILPIVSLVLSVLLTLLVAFNMVGAGLRNIIVLAVIFLASNILTIVFGGIWMHYKGRQDVLDGLKRMQIEDLE